MRKYVFRRLLLAVPTLVGVTLLIFVVMRVIPGDPLALVMGGEGQVAHVLSGEELAKARASLGLDRPLYRQYAGWIADVARGRLGTSFWRKTPVTELIVRRGAITAQIAIIAVALSWLVGLPSGILSAAKRNTRVDYGTRLLVTLFMAMPSFWIGTIIVTLGVIWFSWRPPMGIIYIWDRPWQNLQSTLFPALTLALGMGAVVARMARATILEVLQEDYVRTARAKGLQESLVMWRHVLKNALLPVITISGLQIGALLGGAVAVERAFGVPGLGMALILAIAERDWVVIQNLVLIYGVIFVIVNLLVDLSYGWLDPRVRYQ
ncbi:MAG: ABC transporter permease [Chloroflexota bacterium]|nr:ABC transporter permease [Chloroflexota bacterium]